MARIQLRALLVLLIMTTWIGISGQESLRLMLRGVSYPNNGFVLLSEIGEGDDALICTTTRTDCCIGSNRAGEFFFPNGHQILHLNVVGADGFYRNRGPSLVRLNRLSTASENVTGLFSCEIPDSSGTLISISINIVEELPPMIIAIAPITSSGTNTVGQQFNLTCTATVEESYTPAITWIDGNSMTVPSGGGDTRMVSTVMSSDSTHTSILQFNSLQSSHVGMYTCQVSVLAGTVTEMRSINITVVDIGEDDNALLCVTNHIECCRGKDNPNGGTLGQWYFPDNAAVGILGDPQRNGDFFYRRRGPSIVILYRRGNPTTPTGLYRCEVPDSSGVNQTVYANIRTAMITINTAPITSSGTNTAGQHFNLTCTASVEGSSDIPIITWLYGNTMIVPSGGGDTRMVSPLMSSGSTHTSILQFDPLQSSHEGMYTCRISMPAGTETEIRITNVTVNVPAPSSPIIVMTTSQTSNSITITWAQPQDNVVDRYEIAYSYQGPCSGVTQSESGTLDDGSRREFTAEDLHEFSNYTITITAVNSAGASQPVSRTVTTLPAAPSGRPQSLIVISTTPTTITIQWGGVECVQQNSEITGYTVRYGRVTSNVSETTTKTFTATELTPRTSYTFEVAANSVSGTGPSSFVSKDTAIPENVGFLINGQLYGNNSIVTLDEIGEYSAALLCLTNKTDCCSSAEAGRGPSGNWFFPNGYQVQSPSFARDFYRNRGPSVVRLHRKNSAQTTGIFRCNVEDVSGTKQQLYVGVYLVNSGSPSITGVLFDRSTLTLTCTSTGGPATTVTWMKNGVVVEVNDTNYQQSQIVLNTERATYENILSSNEFSNLVGNFQCCVRNVRGSLCENITLVGVRILGGDQPLTVGEMGTIRCVSVVPANIIEWLDSQGRVVASVTSMNQLDLIFNPVNDSIHNIDYTCRVLTDSGRVSELNVISKIIVPSDAMITVDINAPGSPHVGQSFSLMCNASTTPNGLTAITTWTYPNGSTIPQPFPNSILTFHRLTTSHAGQYTCNGRVESEALSSPLTAVKSHIVRIMIPTPEVTVSVPNGPLYAGTTITLTCTVTLNDAVDINDVMMEVTWLRSGTSLLNSTSRVTISPLANLKMMNTFIGNLTLSPLSSVDNTSFTCKAVARPRSTSQYLDASDTVIKTSHITLEFPMIFRGVSYPNNTALSLNDIGEYSTGSAILCVTNRRPCCSTPPNRHGEWYYPDGTTVPKSAGGDDFWRGREENQTIYLNRRNNAQSPTGSFCCQLPDDSGKVFTWCIMLVTINFTITPSGADVVGEQFSLMCTADETAFIQWLGPDNTLVFDTHMRMVTTTPYSSILLFDPLHSEHAGTYTCQVTVRTVREMASFDIAAVVPSVTVMVSGGIPTAGQSYSLTCTVSGADQLNPIKTYQWFKTNPETQVGGNSSTLSFTSLRLSDTGQYRCDVMVSSTYLSHDIIAMSDTEDLRIMIPTPTVSLNIPAILYAGIPIILTCTIIVDDAVDAYVEVDVTWTPSSDRLNIQTTTGSRPSFTSTVTVSPLSSADTGFTCSAVIRPPSGSSFIGASGPGIDTRDVIVQEVFVKISDSNVPVIFGQSHFLTCTVSGTDQLNPIITYQWFKTNPETQVGTNSSILSFTPLRLSNAGQYRCDVTVSSDYLSEDITQSSNTQDVMFPSVLIQLRMSGLSNCHEWALADTSDKINEVIDFLVTAVEQECHCGFTKHHIAEFAFKCFPGSETHVTFRARLSHTSKATTPQLISYVEQWLLSTKTISIQMFLLDVNTTCDLLITDLGDPECPETTQHSKTVIQSMEIFQLKFGSTEHCIMWSSNKAKEVQSDIHKAILQALTSRCQCTISQDNILNGVFSCQDSQDQTTYRSTIAGIQSHNATELVEFIQDWVHSRPTMTIQWYTVKIDHTCPVCISSLDDPECGMDT